MLHQYSPTDVIGSWGEVLFTGFSDGTMFTVEYNEDAITVHTGAQGDKTAIVSADRGGTVTINLGQASPCNDLLSAAAVVQRRDRVLIKKKLIIKDTKGNTLIDAPEAWIKKEPSVEFGDDHSAREWVFEVAVLTMFVGGSVR